MPKHDPDHPELFTPPYQRHRQTSRRASDEIKPDAGTLRRKVYSFLSAQLDGATDQEMQTALLMDPSTQRPRRVELVRAGMVKDSGQKRKTASGKQATVWVVAGKENERARLTDYWLAHRDRILAPYFGDE